MADWAVYAFGLDLSQQFLNKTGKITNKFFNAEQILACRTHWLNPLSIHNKRLRLATVYLIWIFITCDIFDWVLKLCHCLATRGTKIIFRNITERFLGMCSCLIVRFLGADEVQIEYTVSCFSSASTEGIWTSFCFQNQKRVQMPPN